MKKELIKLKYNEGGEGDSSDYYEDYYKGGENIERNWEDTI